MKNKKLLYGLTILVLLGAGALGAHTYICRFGGQCSSTKYGVILRYPAAWKLKQNKPQTGDDKQSSSVSLADPKRHAPIDLGPIGGITVSGKNDHLVQLVHAQPEKGVADTWDVRLVIEYPDNVYGDTFNPTELLVSATNYHKLGLVEDKMVPMVQQAWPVFTAHGKQMYLGTFGQGLIRDIKTAQAWFNSPEALEAHQIILHARVTN